MIYIAEISSKQLFTVINIITDEDIVIGIKKTKIILTIKFYSEEMLEDKTRIEEIFNSSREYQPPPSLIREKRVQPVMTFLPCFFSFSPAND